MFGDDAEPTLEYMTATNPLDATPAGALDRIRGEFADISRRMTTVSIELTELQRLITAPAPAVPGPPPPPSTPYPPTPYPSTPYPSTAAGFVPPNVVSTPRHVPPVPPQPRLFPATAAHPYPGPPAHLPPRPYAPPFTPVPAPRKPSTPLSERIAAATERGLIGKILAGVGVAITLIGVVLLLVLAAQAGLLRPEIRVAGGAVLAAVLFGLGVWLGGKPEKRSGAAALVATGVAAALFDVLAATAIYHWLPAYAAILVAAVIAAGGLRVAHVWSSQALGLMVSIPLMALAPFLTGGADELLIGFLLVYVAATLWIQLGRNWIAMHAVNTAASTLPLLFVVVFTPEVDRWFFTVAVVTNVVLAVGSSIALMPSSREPIVAALIAAVSIIPMIGAANVTGEVVAASILGGITVVLVLIALAGAGLPGVNREVRVVWLSSAAVTALTAAGTVLDGFGMSVAVAGIAVVTGIAAVTAVTSVSAKDLGVPLRIIATVFTGLALLSTAASGSLAQLFVVDALPTSEQVLLLVVVALTLAAVAVLTYTWGQAAGHQQQTIAIVGSLFALWLVTLGCVGLGTLIGAGTDAGIRGGHAAATIVWVLAAAVGLLWARRQRGGSRAVTLTASLAVIAAAVAKLFLFDLAALDGVFRVIAFIVVGLLLLSLGVAYAQSLSSDERDGHPVAAPLTRHN